MQKSITFNITDDQISVKAENIKDVWVFPICRKTKDYGLAFSDDKWAKKTLITSKYYDSLIKKKKEIQIALAFNRSNITI